LVGELGAGKTQFAQGAAEYLGIKRNVTSPTFVLMKKYKLTGGNFNAMYHIDCYRLHSSRELLDLGWKEIAKEPNNIIFIEWAEKVKNILPEYTIWVTMKDIGNNKREVIFS
ncbi:MAG: tRNA (adenosine(37)-N6)-threonylcarbamoyltransferase complex ATPase subunit type 1 TsaE, partial [Candidatus Spechtbacteria bacterium RIFCSPLOWO2_02_FULL_38_8]